MCVYCHGTRIPAYGFYYRSQPGFRGRDQVVVSTVLNNGRVDVRTDYTYDITVK